MDLNLYNHFILAAVAATAIFICTKSWYRAGLWIMLCLFLVDLYVRTFISFDLVLVVIALLAVPSIIRDMLNKKASFMTRKTRVLTGLFFITLGALTLAILSYPYFLIAGLIITIHAYLSKS